jgi:Cytochrome c7 and related cytochrome c
MKKLIMILGFSLASSGIALAKPNVVKGAKCVACHTEAIGKKTNLSPASAEMLKKYPGQKCAECHDKNEDGKKLTCTDPKTCKDKKK